MLTKSFQDDNDMNMLGMSNVLAIPCEGIFFLQRHGYNRWKYSGNLEVIFITQNTFKTWSDLPYSIFYYHSSIFMLFQIQDPLASSHPCVRITWQLCLLSFASFQNRSLITNTTGHFFNSLLRSVDIFATAISASVRIIMGCLALTWSHVYEEWFLPTCYFTCTRTASWWVL